MTRAPRPVVRFAFFCLGANRNAKGFLDVTSVFRTLPSVPDKDKGVSIDPSASSPRSRGRSSRDLPKLSEGSLQILSRKEIDHLELVFVKPEQDPRPSWIGRILR